MAAGSNDTRWLERNVKWLLPTAILGSAMLVAASVAGLAHIIFQHSGRLIRTSTR